MNAAARRALRHMLLREVPWLTDPAVGPQNVDAGMCGACRTSPALIPVCGPVAYQAVCKTCCLTRGEALFCDGHTEDAAYARMFCETLPAQWAELVVLWWFATGEVTLAGDLHDDSVIFDPLAQRVSITEVVRTNTELLRGRNVLFSVIDE